MMKIEDVIEAIMSLDEDIKARLYALHPNAKIEIRETLEHRGPLSEIEIKATTDQVNGDDPIVQKYRISFERFR